MTEHIQRRMHMIKLDPEQALTVDNSDRPGLLASYLGQPLTYKYMSMTTSSSDKVFLKEEVTLPNIRSVFPEKFGPFPMINFNFKIQLDFPATEKGGGFVAIAFDPALVSSDYSAKDYVGPSVGETYRRVSILDHTLIPIGPPSLVEILVPTPCTQSYLKHTDNTIFGRLLVLSVTNVEFPDNYTVPITLSMHDTKVGGFAGSISTL